MIDPLTWLLLALLAGDDDAPLTKADLSTEMRRTRARDKAYKRATGRTERDELTGGQGLG